MFGNPSLERYEKPNFEKSFPRALNNFNSIDVKNSARPKICVVEKPMQRDSAGAKKRFNHTQLCLTLCLRSGGFPT